MSSVDDATATQPAAMDASQPATTDAPKAVGRLRGRRRAEAEGPLGATAEGAVGAAHTPIAAIPAANTSGRPPRSVRVAPQIPADLLENQALARAIAVLPANYNFEIYKTLWRVREAKARCVGLQFPEGLLMYSCIISDILAQFAGVETVILGDVTYGACCVDDFTARALGCDFLVHYGHSCLVPIDVSTIRMLYVFVDITIDTAHLVRTLKANFDSKAKLVLAGTIQFATAIATVAQELKTHFTEMYVPQAKPLSKGEVLGCTSPKFEGFDAVIFLADGRFHLESLMIHNPHISAFYKYDPYGKRLTRESYAYQQMHDLRQAAIKTATGAKRWGLILGTLGRQGNMNILARIESLLKARNREYILVLLSEVFPDKLARFGTVDAWVQVACPRLSIDWGYAFPQPLLSSYEAEVALGEATWQEVYPMDYYADAGGSWSNYHALTKQKITGTNIAGVGAAPTSAPTNNPIRARKEARLAAAAAAAAAAAGGATVVPSTSAPKLDIGYE